MQYRKLGHAEARVSVISLGGCDTCPVRPTDSQGDDLDPAWYLNDAIL
jgi:hypothetical protein